MILKSKPILALNNFLILLVIQNICFGVWSCQVAISQMEGNGRELIRIPFVGYFLARKIK